MTPIARFTPFRLAGLVTLALSQLLSAQTVQVFPMNLAGFQAAAGNLSVAIDFDHIAPGTDLTDLNFAGVTLEGPGSPLLVVRGQDTFTPSGFAYAPHPGQNVLIPSTGDRLLSPGGNELAPGPDPALESDHLTIRFDSPVAAFGLDHASQSADGWSFTRVYVYDPTGALLHTGVLPITNNGSNGGPAATDFWGIVASTPAISRIEFDETDNNANVPDSNVGYDSLRYVAPTTSQPETDDLGGACGAILPHLLVGLPILGETVPVDLTGATPVVGTWLLAGLPVAPSPLGTCTLHVGSLVPLATPTTDSAGAWSTTLTVPNAQGLAGLPLHLQTVVFGVVSPQGFDLSNGVAVRLGF